MRGLCASHKKKSRTVSEMFGVRVFDVFRVFNVFRCGLAGGLVDGLEGGQSIDFGPQHATVRENAHNFDQDRSIHHKKQ